jgi:predicted N-acyltransferase
VMGGRRIAQRICVLKAERLVGAYWAEIEAVAP